MRNSIIIATLALCCTICTIPACSQIKYTNMEKGEFCTYIKDSSVVLIDVRTPEEYNNGHIENAINIDFYSKTFTDVNKYSSDFPYLFRCEVSSLLSSSLVW